MARPEPPIVKRSLFSWIFAGNTKLQLLLVLVSSGMAFAKLAPLEAGRQIINEAIKLRSMDKLIFWCGTFLAAVVLFSALKYLSNIIQTLISQRATAQMRKSLYQHILTLPLNFFRKTQPGTVVNALTAELTLPGNFVGMAVATPVTNFLTLLFFAVYLFFLNPLLAAVSLSIYPIIIFLVPLLQKGVNKANKKRVDAARTFSARIAESISGIHEIHGNGAYQIEGRKYNKLVDRLLKIRIVWSLYRFAVKTANGFFTNLGPFLVFLLGGYLTIKGQMDLGALVAFLSAQKELFDPWKELIEFYQVYQDGQVNYKRTMEHFDVTTEHEIEPRDRDALDLEGSVEVKDLSFVTDTGIRLLDGINMSLKPGEHLALVGFSGSGKSTLASCIGQLYKYTGGSVMIGDKEVSGLTKKDMINNIGFVAQNPFIFDGTIEENILYSTQAKIGDNGQEGVNGEMPTLDDIIAVLHQTGIFVDVLRFGLNAILTQDKYAESINAIVRIRKNFQQDYGEELADYVEFFDENQYLYYSSVSENLTFGAANKSEFTNENLAKSKYFIDFLDTADLTRPLLSLGANLCRQTVDILGNLPPDAVFFEQSPINADELEDFKVLEEHLRKKRLHELDAGDRDQLLELALRFTPGIHKMAALPEILEMLILEGRALFREKIAEDDPGAFTFYQMSEYIYSQTILNNIFFGKTKTSSPQAQEIINQSIIQLLIEEDLLETIIEIGMQYQVGTKGDKLSGGQQQKLAIARIFLKAPRILIMDEATSALDNKAQTRIQNLLETRWKKKSTVVSVVHRLDTIKNYDKVAVMKAGKILEMGTYDELMARKGMLYELVGNK